MDGFFHQVHRFGNRPSPGFSVNSGPKKASQMGGQPTAPERPEAASEEDRVARVDLWFDQQITELYGEVAEEPVPQEILDLVKKLKSPH